MTTHEAIAMGQTEWWKGKTAHEIVRFQLFETFMCMPFGDFHGAVEEVLGRPVWTHEFAYPEHLRDEFIGLSGKPTFTEICDLLPADKAVIVGPSAQPACVAECGEDELGPCPGVPTCPDYEGPKGKTNG